VQLSPAEACNILVQSPLLQLTANGAVASLQLVPLGQAVSAAAAAGQLPDLSMLPVHLFHVQAHRCILVLQELQHRQHSASGSSSALQAVLQHAVRYIGAPLTSFLDVGSMAMAQAALDQIRLLTAGVRPATRDE
jgi:hypothetical protein